MRPRSRSADFPLRQVQLLVQLCQGAHVELSGVAGEQLRAQPSIRPGCACATTLLHLLKVGPLREVRTSLPTVQVRVVVDILSLHRFGDHDRVAHEPEQTSKCPAAKLSLAACEVAQKSPGLSQLRLPDW